MVHRTSTAAPTVLWLQSTQYFTRTVFVCRVATTVPTGAIFHPKHYMQRQIFISEFNNNIYPYTVYVYLIEWKRL